MSEDEFFVTILALLVGMGGWVLWLFRVGSIDGLTQRRSPLKKVIVVLGGLSVLLMVVLRTLAADDVREAPPYLFMYFVLGLAWMRAAMQFFPFMGLHPRDDLFERGNRASLPAWTGAMAGVTLCFSGANIGNGPGWWVVVFSAAVATAALAGIWFVLGTSAQLTDAVVIDRDPAAGIRLGGALAACGLICGTAVAGDWVSAPATVADFVMRAWPAVLVMVIALGVERGVRPRPEQPRGPLMATGILPAIAYFAVAAALSYRGSAQW